MIRAHKIRLHPTPERAQYFARAAGTSRFVWNWALAEWNRQYEAGEKPTAFKLKKQFNEMKREQYPWTWDVTKNASDQPILDLGKAFMVFFAGGARRPRFKSKKRSKASFFLANDQFELGNHRIWIPKLGWVNLAENLRFTGKVTCERITKKADWWDVAIMVEVPDAQPEKRPAAIGIDVGLNRLATLSTGVEYENQAFLGIEDLNLKGLFKNRRVSRSFSDAALGKLFSLLDAKVERFGGQVIRVGRFFPSSKTCHSCGWKWEGMQLLDRVFLCQNPTCAYHRIPQDRDYSASLNILQEALRLIGLIEQVVSGTGSDVDVNLAVDLM
jgi:putative transposase